jgi:hypothetical protein
MRLTFKAARNSRALLVLLAGAALLALGLAWQWPAESDSRTVRRGMSTDCEVGGKPALRAHRVYPDMGKLIAGPIVIGCGYSSGELVEMVAFHTSKELCVEMERPARKTIVGGECKSNRRSWPYTCNSLCIFSVLPIDLNRVGKYEHSIVSGLADPEVTSFKVVARESGHSIEASVIEARVESEELLGALGEDVPFLAFGAVLPRCVSPHSVEVVANGSGRAFRRHGLDLIPGSCK